VPRASTTAALVFLASVLLIGGGGSVVERRDTPPQRRRRQPSPEQWARGKMKAMTALWSRVGAILARMVPDVFPNAPPEAFIPTMVNNGQREDNANVRGMRAHEIGWFAVYAGPSSGPAPNPDPSARDNQWGVAAVSSQVQSLLGRSATMEPGAWADAIDDQIAVGLVNLRQQVEILYRAFPAIRAQVLGGQWDVACALCSAAAGPGLFASQLRAWAAQIVAAPEQSRWSVFVRLASLLTPGLRTYSNPAYLALRTQQKLTAGEYLARGLGLSADWFALNLEDQRATFAALTTAANGVT
jgi:hypothetical protein